MPHAVGRIAPSLFAFALALAAGCDKDDSGNGFDLEGRTFFAQSATDNGQLHAIVAGTTLSLSFRDGARVGASAGCNSLDGSYAIEGGQLVITNAGWTEIGCEPDLAAQETWYFEFLLSEPGFAQSGDTLTLTGDVTEIEYLDKEVATPDRELVGPLWTVDTLIEGDGASSATWSELATFRFNDDGQVEVATGCNTGAGGYTVDDGTITFADVGVTEEACVDELQQRLEDGVLRVVHHGGPVTFEIDANRMTLEAPGFGLGLTAD